MMNRRQFMKTVGAGLGAFSLPRWTWPERNRKPNIVVIVSDDQGYADLGVYGCLDIPTPNIDSIAKNGVRFTSGYVSSPVCSPTRAGIQTGRYQNRYGHEYNPGPKQFADPNFGLSLQEVTIAERLKSAGYVTGLIGKWHLGFKPEFHPLNRGYDEFFGFLSGAHNYIFNPTSLRGSIFRGTKPEKEKDYLTSAFGREAVSFIERHMSETFFLLVCFNAVHTPLQASKQYMRRFRKIRNPVRRSCAAMLSALDDAVGNIFRKLRETGLEKDTLVIYLSDNGAPTKSNGSLNRPFSGYKGQLLEGGIRVPFLMQWKGQLPLNAVYDYPVISLDIHPTCLAAAGFDIHIPENKPLDGVNLLPYLKGEISGPPHEVLYWRIIPHYALRRGNYKMVRFKGQEKLFNLQEDPGEKEDLKIQKPEMARMLRQELEEWSTEMRMPAWDWGGRTLKYIQMFKHF